MQTLFSAFGHLAGFGDYFDPQTYVSSFSSRQNIKCSSLETAGLPHSGFFDATVDASTDDFLLKLSPRSSIIDLRKNKNDDVLILSASSKNDVQKEEDPISYLAREVFRIQHACRESNIADQKIFIITGSEKNAVAAYSGTLKDKVIDALEKEFFFRRVSIWEQREGSVTIILKDNLQTPLTPRQIIRN